MTDPEINKAIAESEACGFVWYVIPHHPSDTSRKIRLLAHPKIHEYPDQSPAWLIRADGTESPCSEEYMHREGHVPKFTEDLDACHAWFENWLDTQPVDTQSLYLDYLSLNAEVSKAKNPAEARWLASWTVVRATARQRCEALLRTIGKWKEDSNAQ